jgi:hypothetical protein
VTIRSFLRGRSQGPRPAAESKPPDPSPAPEPGATLDELTMAAILKRVDDALSGPPEAAIDEPADTTVVEGATQTSPSVSRTFTPIEDDGSPRYEAREEAGVWFVADRRTGTVAEVHGFVLSRLSVVRARSLAEVLNRVELRGRQPKHSPQSTSR